MKKLIVKGILYGIGLWIACDTILGITMLTLPEYEAPVTVEISDFAKEIIERED